MTQRFRKTLLAATAAAGFAGMSPAVEPLNSRLVEIVKVSTTDEGPSEETKTAAILACMIVLGGLGAWASLRGRSMFGDRNDDDCWKD